MRGAGGGESQGRLIRDLAGEAGRLAIQESEKRAFQGGSVTNVNMLQQSHGD